VVLHTQCSDALPGIPDTVEVVQELTETFGSAKYPSQDATIQTLITTSHHHSRDVAGNKLTMSQGETNQQTAK
jgi:hypothetical protein